MIPYPHDTTESVDVIEPVIERSAFLDGRRPAPRRGFVFGAMVVALCLHGYALAVLPDAMEIDIEQAQEDNPALLNDEVNNDPDLPTNYNVDRIEELGIPGPLIVEAMDPRTDTAEAANGAPATPGEPSR